MYNFPLRSASVVALNYFSHINKTSIELAIGEAAGDRARLAVAAAKKKSEAVIIAGRLVKGTGWLPEHICIEQPQVKAETIVVSANPLDDDAGNDSDGGRTNVITVSFDQAAE
jgi:hypothetical protein